MKIEDYVKILKRAKQIVLTGAPGTGKTYLAYKIAESLVFQNKGKNEEAIRNQIRRVQFHSSYDYTDFVEGLRPVMSDDDDCKTVGFKRQDGDFKEFCKWAVEDLGNFDTCFKKLR